ncbi:glycosyltransferase family 39 protein [Chloroflexota bacterium]
MDYKKLILTTFRNLLIVYFTFLLLEHLKSGSVANYFNTDYLLYAVMFCGFIILWIYLQEKKIRKIVPLIFLASLILFCLDSTFNWSFLQDYQAHLVIAVVSLGGLVFWFNRDKITLESGWEAEKLIEEKRKEEFKEKLPRVEKFAGLYWFVKWMYKEGWIYSIGLILLVLVGSMLRLWNLGKLGIWWDEGIVYMSGQSILETGLPYLDSAFLYTRDLPHLYTTALSLAIFGENEFALRLPSVIFGVLLIVVVYWLSKEILKNKNVALLAATIVTFHYWFIEFSRWGRSYTMVALLVSLSILFFYKGFVGNNRKYIILFALTAFLSAMTHQTGQIVLLLFLLIPLFSKFKFKNLIQLKYVLPLIASFSGILLYKFLDNLGYYKHTIQQESDQPSNFVSDLINQIPFGGTDIHNLEIFSVVSVFIVIGAISTVTNILLILSRRNNAYPKGLKYLNYIFLIFLLAVLFSDEFVGANRIIFFSFSLITILFSATLIGLSKLIRYRKSYLFIIFPVAIMLFVSSIQIPLRDYGDTIVAKYAPWEGIDFYPDNKTPAMMLNDLYEEGDIVIYYTDVIGSWPYYVSYKPTYKVTKERDDKVEGYWLSDGEIIERDACTDTKLITTAAELNSVLESKNRIWAITSYSILSYTEDYPRLFHIGPWTWNALYEHEFIEIYRSKDNVSRLLFKDNTAE